MTPEDSSLIEALPQSALEANGVAEQADVELRERAFALVEKVTASLDGQAELRVSPLGAGWSNDIDVHVSNLPSADELKKAGWLPLSNFSTRPSSMTRWGVLEGSVLLAAVDFHTSPAPNPVDVVLRRCTRRGEVRLREVLELRVLARAGHDLPSHSVITLAAGIEKTLGGNELSGRRTVEQRATHPPVSLGSQRMRSLKKRLSSRTGGQVAIAVSGVDGSGKSTVAEALTTNLQRAGYDVSRIWARPGMEMRTVKAIAKAIKRIRGKSSTSAVRSVARGETSDSLPTSRRGVVGWAWALLVTLSYITRVRTGRRRGGRIMIFDRHLLDALVTLDFVYGTVNLSLHRALIRALVPKADLTLYLDVPADTAISRKESVVFGEHAVREQLKHYEVRAREIDGMVRLDSTLPKDELVAAALRAMTVGPEKVRS